MNLTRVVICVILMALVTYIPRVLPVTIFRKEIKSRFIRSFLDYTPYAAVSYTHLLISVKVLTGPVFML